MKEKKPYGKASNRFGRHPSLFFSFPSWFWVVESSLSLCVPRADQLKATHGTKYKFHGKASEGGEVILEETLCNGQNPLGFDFSSFCVKHSSAKRLIAAFATIPGLIIENVPFNLNDYVSIEAKCDSAALYSSIEFVLREEVEALPYQW